jgi:hypothetical protein
MRPAIRSIRNTSVCSERLDGDVELRNIHDGSFVADGRRSDILGDNGQEGFSICLGREDLHLSEVGSDIGREIFLPSIGRRVHASKNSEVGMPRDWLHGALLS